MERTSLLGMPVIFTNRSRSLSRNEVQIPFSETTWSRVLRLVYIYSTDCTPNAQDTITLSHGYGSIGLHV